MRVVRVTHGEQDYFGELYDEATVRLWSAAPWNGGKATDRFIPFRENTLLAPVTPTKIIAIGRNYRAHAKELGNDVPVEPLLFLKAPSALLPPGAAIELPFASARVEHEAELAIVFGTRARNVSRAEALRFVFGFTCSNDVTARDLQKKDVQFTRAKSFDTFCPIGPWIETDLPENPERRVEARVNGEVRQDALLTDMVFDVPDLISYVSHVMTIEPGDVLLTGTPSGVGPLKSGDTVEIRITGLGVLSNPVSGRAND